LEQELNIFNELGGGVCTMCAPGDQGKSRDSKPEQRSKRSLVSAVSLRGFDLVREADID
jgi:hypothetical protein